MLNRRRVSGLRACSLTVTAAVAAVAVIAWCRPEAVHVSDEDPTSAVVAAAAWLAWALAGYLLLATAAVATGAVPGAAGRAGRRLRRLAPSTLRRAVDIAAGTAVVATVGLTAVPATAAPPSPTTTVTASPLEWPGVSPAATRGRPAAPLVVRSGDCLWSLAATLLGSRATPAMVAREWPRLYAANRVVVGPDPNLIHPGQRLVPPADDERTTR